jgi:hypothetical protein
MISLQEVCRVNYGTYLAETFSLSMLLETESREVNTRAEDLRLCQDTDTTNTIDLHLHIRVTVGVAEVGQMGSPGCIFRIALNNNSVFIERVSEREGGLRFLPGVQIVGLFSTKPVGKRAPDVWDTC